MRRPGYRRARARARARALKISRPSKDAFPGLVAAAVHPAWPAIPSLRPGKEPPRRGRSRCCPEHIGQHCRPPGIRGPDKATENRHDTISYKRRPRLESSRPTRDRTFRCISLMRIPNRNQTRRKCQWCYPEISPERDRYSR